MKYSYPRILQLIAALSSATCISAAWPPHPSEIPAPVRLVYEYPNGTWIENIAVRPNGKLLLAIATSPHLDELDPLEANPEPTTVFNPSNSTAIFAVSETSHDVFSAVVADNYTLSGGAEPGLWKVWKVNFTSPEVSSEAIGGNITPAHLIDGACALPSDPSHPYQQRQKGSDDVLLGDIQRGLIYHFNTTTGAYRVAINDTYTQPAPNRAFGSTGVNGLHVYNGTLYITNTGKGMFYGLPIDLQGTPTGPGRMISQVPNDTLWYDDFTIKHDVAYLVTGGGNSIQRVDLSDKEGKARIIAGSLNSTSIAGPTSCAFGRTEKDKNILYVVTGGGIAAPVNGDIVVGAQVVAVDVGAWERAMKLRGGW